MENFFTRYKNPLVLMAVLVIQVIALATQIKRPENARAAAGGATGAGSTRLIRVWTVTAITPFEEALVATGHFFRNTWHNYLDLHDVRRQNRELQQEIDRMRLEQARLRNDADQDRRLQSLLEFKDRYAGTTVAAQVIGSSGSEQSRVIYIDKGSRAGIRQDMAVITPDGIVGKVRDVYPFSSQVLLISDHDSGAGVILESTRLQGILRGKELGEIRVNDIMMDETVAIGEHVITSGGDRVYPKGLPVGTVTDVRPDPDAPFHIITIKPAANLNRLEEVLVVTKMAEEAPPPPVAGETIHHAVQTFAAAANKPEDRKEEGKPEENAPSRFSGNPLSSDPLAPAATNSPAPAASKSSATGNPPPTASSNSHAAGNPLSPASGKPLKADSPSSPASGKPLAPPSAKPLTAGTGNTTEHASSTAATGNATSRFSSNPASRSFRNPASPASSNPASRSSSNPALPASSNPPPTASGKPLAQPGGKPRTPATGTAPATRAAATLAHPADTTPTPQSAAGEQPAAGQNPSPAQKPATKQKSGPKVSKPGVPAHASPTPQSSPTPQPQISPTPDAAEKPPR